MPAPSTPLLDDFTRADAATLGASWGANIQSGWASHNIVSNQASNLAAAFKSNYWLVPFGADQEAYCTLATAFMAPLICRGSNFGGSTPNYYEMSNSGANVFLVKGVAGTRTQLGPNIGVTLAAGDKACLQVEGPAIRAYRLPSGGAWTLLREETDYDVDGIGFIGVRSEFANSIVFDDFGGGSLPVRAVKPDLRCFPIPMLRSAA